MKVYLEKPTVRDYNRLRELVEWPVLLDEIVEKGLAQTLFSVLVKNEENVVIGMGRVVGDGAIYLHLQDVIVDPSFQRLGVGKLIMKHLLDYVRKTGGSNTNIGLMSSKGREDFYKNFGFVERPSEKFGAGMIMIKK